MEVFGQGWRMKKSSLIYSHGSIRLSTLHFWNFKSKEKNIYWVSQIEELKTEAKPPALVSAHSVFLSLPSGQGVVMAWARRDGGVCLAADAVSVNGSSGRWPGCAARPTLRPSLDEEWEGVVSDSSPQGAYKTPSPKAPAHPLCSPLSSQRPLELVLLLMGLISPGWYNTRGADSPWFSRSWGPSKTMGNLTIIGLHAYLTWDNLLPFNRY